jgi:hypothetical protein
MAAAIAWARELRRWRSVVEMSCLAVYLILTGRATGVVPEEGRLVPRAGTCGKTGVNVSICRMT